MHLSEDSSHPHKFTSVFTVRAPLLRVKQAAKMVNKTTQNAQKPSDKFSLFNALGEGREGERREGR